MTKDEARAYIDARNYGVVATIAANKGPEAALVGIAVTDRFELVFDTTTATRKYKNLVANPQVAFVIGWEDESTLQLEGLARVPEKSDLARFQEAYFKKFPDGRERAQWPNIAYFVVEPTWYRFSDYGCDPPLVVEMTFA